MYKLTLRAAIIALAFSIVSFYAARAQDTVNPDAPYAPPACTTQVTPAPADVANDPDIDPSIRAFLVELDKNPSPFWTLPQPGPQDVLTAIQKKSPVDDSGITVTTVPLAVDGRDIKLYVVKPVHMAAHPGVILFLHGGVWLVGNFENHKHLVRTLVVESGQPAVFLEYTPLPTAKYPVQMDQAYAALEWTYKHAAGFGADPNRIAVVGNSVGGDMTAALTLMDKDRHGPAISYQVLLWPATNASVDTCSYIKYADGRFLARAFMKYGWDLYAPTEEERSNPYVSPLRASLNELQGLPPALTITEENDPLRDEGTEYSHRLEDAGVSVLSIRYNGTIHDFGVLNALANEPSTKAALTRAAEEIRTHIGQ